MQLLFIVIMTKILVKSCYITASFCNPALYPGIRERAEPIGHDFLCLVIQIMQEKCKLIYPDNPGVSLVRIDQCVEGPVFGA